MRSLPALALLLVLLCPACGGLNHIPVVETEGAWRPLTTAPPVATTPAPAHQGAFVAVFDIEDRSRRLKPSEVDGLTEYLAGKQRLLEQKKRSYRQCYDQSCQIDIGREMAAQKVLSTVIASVGSSCLVTVALFDLKKAATEVTASARGGCSADDLLNQIEQAVNKLRGG